MDIDRVSFFEARRAVLSAMRLLNESHSDPYGALALLVPYANEAELAGAAPGQGPRFRTMVRALIADCHREMGRPAEAANWYLLAGSDRPAGGTPFFATLYARMVIDHQLSDHYQTALEYLKADQVDRKIQPFVIRWIWIVYFHLITGCRYVISNRRTRDEIRELRRREPSLMPELERLVNAKPEGI